jgi:diadenosine tetraphosphate (Ap4A) HIT family hydrolase
VGRIVSQAVATKLNGTAPTKINTAAIGNICRQLHVHVLSRYEGDKAWPGPVWGACPAVPWGDKAAEVIALVKAELGV